MNLRVYNVRTGEIIDKSLIFFNQFVISKHSLEPNFCDRFSRRKSKIKRILLKNLIPVKELGFSKDKLYCPECKTSSLTKSSEKLKTKGLLYLCKNCQEKYLFTALRISPN